MRKKFEKECNVYLRFECGAVVETKVKYKYDMTRINRVNKMIEEMETCFGKCEKVCYWGEEFVKENGK